MKRSLLASITLATALAGTFTLPTLAAEDGFTPIFDGKSLTGWEGHASIWSVKDGTITGQTTAETNLKHNTFLVWKGGTVDDFELRFSYRIVKGNSGLQYRSKVAEQGPQGPIVGGYQADFEAGKTYSGILYEERGRGILAERGQRTFIKDNNGQTKVQVVGKLDESANLQAAIRNDDWNDYRIVAHGNHLMHFINNRMTVDVVDFQEAKAAKEGILAFQIHVGPPMVVQFKDVELLALP